MTEAPSLEEIRSRLREVKPRLTEEYGVAEIGVFGSYVRGEQTEGSDIDILVRFEEPIGLMRFVGLQEDLADALGVDVDLTTPASLKPWMRGRVEDEVVPV